jgi:hypothetical protein
VKTLSPQTILLALVFFACIPGFAEDAKQVSCKIQLSNFEGWKAQQISNRWVTLVLVPQLGGRIMQVTFGSHAYLFVNPELKGKYFPPSQATGKWYNYGGDKIWPLPEGTEDAQHWPGPISDELDDGNYDFKILSQDAICKVRLEGPADPRTGLQYSREITLNSDSPEITFHAVMKNTTDHPIRWSMQSVTQYDTASAESPTIYNHDFWAFAPVKTNSAYDGGYRVRLGLANDAAYSVKDGLFGLQWNYFEREVWLDSSSGWLAVVDGSAQYAMVERFPHFEDEYPDKATIIFYTNGPAVEFDAKGMPVLTSSNPAEMPYYMEAEVTSPLVLLKPEETHALDTTWLPTRLGGRPKSVTKAGIVNSHLTAARNGRNIALSGSFGVFFPGTLTAYLYDMKNATVGVVTLQPVNPLETLEVRKEILADPSVARVSIHLVDDHGIDRGSLSDAPIAEAVHAP